MPDPIRMQPNAKWIRGIKDGRTIVDSRHTMFVWEIPYFPAWYVPVADVRAELRPNGAIDEGRDERGPVTRFDVVLSGDGPRLTIANAAWRHLEANPPELRELVRFEWDALDAWFEEDVEVFVHPRSPDVRIDALASSRHVRVLLDDTVIADSTRPTVLFEADLPPRYYLPQADVRMDLLTPTSSSSACPYKGWAHYWTVTTDRSEHTDLAWGYRTPLPESAAIAGLVSFYNEKVDIEIDGVRLARPNTKFS